MLRTALVIDGTAEGAKKAAQETTGAIKDVDKAAADASKSTNAIAGNLEKANAAAGGAAKGLKDVGEAAGNSARPLADVGKAAGEAADKSSKAGQAAGELSRGLGGISPAAEAAWKKLDEFTGAAGRMDQPLKLGTNTILSFVGAFAGGAIGGMIAGAFDGAVQAIVTYAGNALTKTDEIDTALKGHIELIKQIKGAYQEASGGASSYGNNSVSQLRYRNQQQVSELQQAYQYALPSGGQFDIGMYETVVGGPMQGTVKSFLADLRTGKADVIAFREEVAKIASALPEGDAGRNIADILFKETDKAAEVLEKLRRSQDTLKGLEGDSAAAARALGGAAEKYEGLGGAAQNASGQVESAAQAIIESGNAADIASQKIENYKRSLGGVAPSAARSSTLMPDLPPATIVKPFALGGVVDRPTMFGYGDGQSGLMGEAGQEAIIPLKGGAVGARTAGGQETRLQLVRLSDGSLGVDVPKMFAYGGVVSMRGGGAYGGGHSARDSRGRFVSGGYGGFGDDLWGGVYSTLADGLKDVLNGVFESASQGSFKNFWQQFEQIGLQVSRRLFSQLVNQVVNGLMPQGGAGGGGLGGIIGSFLGGGGRGTSWFPSAPVGLYAAGGIANRASIFGEAGPEAAVPLPDGRTIPVTLDMRGSSSRSNITIINNSGARVEHEERDDGRGGRQDVFTVSELVGTAIGTKGGGAGRTLQNQYGLRRQGPVR